MWLWSLDDRLINMDLVESIEVLEVYPEDADPAQLDAGAVEPDLIEVVAILASGDEAVLYDGEDAEDVYRGFDAVARLVASGKDVGGRDVKVPLRVQDLLNPPPGHTN